MVEIKGVNMKLRLRAPQLSDEKEYDAYLNEWLDPNKIVPYSSRLLHRTFEQFVKEIKPREEGLIDPETRVPELILFTVDENESIYGVVSFRLRLNDHLLAYDGHIGYGIRPSKRGLGYAKEQLRLTLALAKEKGYDRVLLTCNEENIASEKVILSQGGILENRVWKTDGYIKRYWIKLC